jgi:hypothetical protein
MSEQCRECGESFDRTQLLAGYCGPCLAGECEILCEVDGVASGERVGVCLADGRPVFRSRMAGTIYHATADR